MTLLTKSRTHAGHRYSRLAPVQEKPAGPYRHQRSHSAWKNTISRALSNLGTAATTSRLPEQHTIQGAPPADPSLLQRLQEVNTAREGLENYGPRTRLEIPKEISAFAVQTQTLIPLRDALNRDDIRRRDEGFELAEAKQSRRRGGVYLGSRRRITSSVVSGASSSDLPATTVLPALPSAASTLPSIYSTASWEGFDVAPFDVSGEIEMSALFDADMDSLHGRLCGLADLAETSFDEETFLRMASEIGW